MSYFAPEIDIPAGVRLEIDAWGQPWPCWFKGSTMVFEKTMVPRSATVRVIAKPGHEAAAERFVAVLVKAGWRNAVVVPESVEVAE